MIEHRILTEAGTHLEEQRYAEAAELLTRIEVQKLTGEEQNRLDSLFAALPREYTDSSVELCYRAALLQIQRGDLAAAREWQGNLTALRKSLKEGTPQRQTLENRIFCVALSMPLGPNANLLLSLAVIGNEFGHAKIPLARLSATGKYPSVLRGAKDLSDLAKHHRASASIVRPLLPAFLEDEGRGVCETAIAELLYEKNDLNGASMQAAVAIGAENPEIAFAALALLARLGAVDPSARPPVEILAHLGDLLEKKDAHWLLPNYKALCTRFDILRGDPEQVRAWLDGCGLNDLEKLPLRDGYAFLTKARAYIALGEYSHAATLLEALTVVMQQERRVLDTVECLALSAVACALLGSDDTALAKLEQALCLAVEFGYIRVFADCGKQMFHLLVRYAREGQPHSELGGAYIKKITESAKTFSTLHPALFAKKGDDTAPASALTQSELHVLQLLDEGKSNKLIAKELHVQPSTVSFHLTNIFEKLGAANRTEAIKRAREKGLVE